MKLSYNAFDGKDKEFVEIKKLICESIGGSYPPHNLDKLYQDCFYLDIRCDENKFPGLFKFLNFPENIQTLSSDICLNVAKDLEHFLDIIFETESKTRGTQSNLGNKVKSIIRACYEANNQNDSIIVLE